MSFAIWLYHTNPSNNHVIKMLTATCCEMYVIYDRLIQNHLPNLGICWYINYNPLYQMEADQITLNWTLVLYNYKRLQKWFSTWKVLDGLRKCIGFGFCTHQAGIHAIKMRFHERIMAPIFSDATIFHNCYHISFPDSRKPVSDYDCRGPFADFPKCVLYMSLRFQI